MQRERGGQSQGPPGPEVKAVIVGDGGCGKTSLLVAFARGDFPKVYVPTVFEKYTASLEVGGKTVTIHLWDTAGQEDYDRLRPLSYSDANVVLICFDVTNPNSYNNVVTKWYPEVNHFCKGIPVLLVGCKTDLRQDREVLHKLKEGRLEPISYQQLLPDPSATTTTLPSHRNPHCGAGTASCHGVPPGRHLLSMKKPSHQGQQHPSTSCRLLAPRADGLWEQRTDFGEFPFLLAGQPGRGDTG
ncbi:rho-related GTP-binding protein RhoD isoform X1 [Cuculus canorus]|uniref:rho-related GTP-binding protein RhoD isoform X1 n=1 Tax=Cuculus canorus TaxID=55661 RepID=UPI0023AA2D93|nr:rho-related GTP-binding protein RhoD isoform X1 [Cuculus canorus]